MIFWQKHVQEFFPTLPGKKKLLARYLFLSFSLLCIIFYSRFCRARIVFMEIAQPFPPARRSNGLSLSSQVSKPLQSWLWS